MKSLRKFYLVFVQNILKNNKLSEKKREKKKTQSNCGSLGRIAMMNRWHHLSLIWTCLLSGMRTITRRKLGIREFSWWDLFVITHTHTHTLHQVYLNSLLEILVKIILAAVNLSKVKIWDDVSLTQSNAKHMPIHFTKSNCYDKKSSNFELAHRCLYNLTCLWKMYTTTCTAGLGDVSIL